MVWWWEGGVHLCLKGKVITLEKKIGQLEQTDSAKSWFYKPQQRKGHIGRSVSMKPEENVPNLPRSSRSLSATFWKGEGEKHAGIIIKPETMGAKAKQ